jgi:hypothetical protein
VELAPDGTDQPRIVLVIKKLFRQFEYE